MSKIFETVSFHIVKPCNMKCKFCYATFDDMHGVKTMPLVEACLIVNKLAEAGVKKITFAGGEPMLYKDLDAVIKYTKSLGLTTSIITNGSLLTTEWLKNMRPYLDWIGISIDSTRFITNNSIGRVNNGFRNCTDITFYAEIIRKIRRNSYKLKINTVVNRYNEREYLRYFVEWSGATRWKVFDTLKVIGQNDKQFDEIKSTDFKGFVERNKCDVMVVESNELMIGGYLLVDPIGRLFEDTAGHHTYSDQLQFNTIEHCLSQINLKRDVFLNRGGIYEW